MEDGTDKWLVSGKSFFDSYGRNIKTTMPFSIPYSFIKNYNTAFPAACDSITYDILDRPLTQTSPDQTTTHYYYGFDNDQSGTQRFFTNITDPLNNTSTVFTDPRGLKTMVTNPLSTTTKFEYNAVGELLQSTDPENNTTTYLYNLTGKMTQREHPDAGTTSYSFDPAGNLLTTQTENLEQNSEFITYEYDYNRLKSISYPDNPENKVYYKYGDSGDGNQSGRITRMQDASGTQEFIYGNMGELIKNVHTYVVPNGYFFTFEMDWEYDSWNRVKNITYPDGETVEYQYNNGGQLMHMEGNKGSDNYKYIDSVNYNMYGSRSKIVYGNGTRSLYEYHPLNLRLTSLKTYDANNDLMLDLSYDYDNAGNIEQIDNAAYTLPNSLGGQYSYSYTYDDLYRLTNAEGAFESDDYGSFPFETQMEYSASGNITNKDVEADLFINGSTPSINYSNQYFYNNRPHTVSQAGNYNGNYNYDWDANGNMILRSPIDDGFTRRLCWDEENRLTTVRDAGGEPPMYLSSYIYNAAGERTWKLAGEDQLMWISGDLVVNAVYFFNTLYSSPYMVMNEKEYTKHYYIEGERVCSKIGSGFEYANIDPTGDPIDAINGETGHIASDLWTMVLRGISCTEYNTENVSVYPKLDPAYNIQNEKEENQYFYHTDHLGSSSFISDASGDAVQHLQYLPFGETFIDERTDAQYNTPYKFSGKEKDDETQYSYFGARYYDSDLSVWLSVDPLAGKYPSMSPYMYCAGNPVMLVDPDGREIWIEGEDGNRIQYKQGMTYNGTDKKILAKVSSLNIMNQTKNGEVVLSTLTNSTNIYNIRDGEGSNPTFCANNDIDGKMGGIINTVGKDGLLEIPHELFHAFQDENGQGGASVFNEVEAYLFSVGISIEYSFQNNEMGGSGSSFVTTKNPESEAGKSYENSVNELLYGNSFSKSDFINAVQLFKSQSSKNANGDYNKMPLQRNNQKSSLLKRFYPLFK